MSSMRASCCKKVKDLLQCRQKLGRIYIQGRCEDFGEIVIPWMDEKNLRNEIRRE